MFSEPTITSVRNLFSAPGLGLELAGASVLAFAILCYLVRVALISLSYARRTEMAPPPVAIASEDFTYNGPYCAG